MAPAPDTSRRLLPRPLVAALAVIAVLLVPWTLWLTFTLPSRHVTHHYDVAWVGFDIALAAAFAASAVSALRSSRWLQPLATVTGTMLLCDAWFDVVTSTNGDEQLVAILEAVVAELPLAALCGWIVLDTARFQDAVERRSDEFWRWRESLSVEGTGSPDGLEAPRSSRASERPPRERRRDRT